MSEPLNPNERVYLARNKGQYLSTRLLNHGGTTIAFALGTTNPGSPWAGSLFMDYSVLNAADHDSGKETTAKETAEVLTEKLDSQRWFDNAKLLRFPSEVRAVGEEAVPVYQVPTVDPTGRRVDREDFAKQDTFKSTSLSLMHPAVHNFEVLSDGKYVYVFRQSRGCRDPFLSTLSKEKPPIDSNLLCDRFTLLGTNLSRTLEVRYRRSRQKRLPLNDKDTLAVRDINDVPFYEPTFSLRFVKDMVQGWFTVLQTPTMTNGMSRWMIFAYSARTSQIECFSTDVASDGLFDIHGQIYYTCNTDHEDTFATTPGVCSALRKSGAVCDSVRMPIVPKLTGSEWALLFAPKPSAQVTLKSPLPKAQHITELSLPRPIDLSESPFGQGFTLEAWIKPSSAGWEVRPATSNGDSAPQNVAAAASMNDTAPSGNATGSSGDKDTSTAQTANPQDATVTDNVTKQVDATASLGDGNTTTHTATQDDKAPENNAGAPADGNKTAEGAEGEQAATKNDTLATNGSAAANGGNGSSDDAEPKTPATQNDATAVKDSTDSVNNGVPGAAKKDTEGGSAAPKVVPAPAKPALALPPPGSTFRLFSMVADPMQVEPSLSIWLDAELRLVAKILGANTTTELASSTALTADSWNHIALIFTADKTRTISLVVNGSDSGSKPGNLPEKFKPGYLRALISQPKNEAQQFHGIRDEVRLWSYPLQPASIKSKMSVRATGMEPFLEACWHFDEGTGNKAFDATINGHDMDIVLGPSDESLRSYWTSWAAPMMGTVGLSRRILRLEPGPSVGGGMSASVYFEQVTVTPSEPSAAVTDSKATSTPAAKPEQAAPAPGPSKIEQKPLKRGARVLLCFVACAKDGIEPTLAVFDFALLSDGSLCDWPATLPLPPIKISPRPGYPEKSVQYAPSMLLWVDPQGMEVFGGILDFAAGRCTPAPPCVWDSATGTVTLFYQAKPDHSDSAPFSALVYDISRSIEATALNTLSGFSSILAAGKLRQAKTIDISTSRANEAPASVAIDVKISATTTGGLVQEIWRCLPATVEKLCDLLSGRSVLEQYTIGKTSAKPKRIANDELENASTFNIEFAEGIPKDVPAATCIGIGLYRYLVLKDAMKDGNVLMVSGLDLPEDGVPAVGSVVTFIGYDHEHLVHATGQTASSFRGGSNIITIAAGLPSPGERIKVPATSLITSQGQGPFFASPAPSSALQLKDNTVYSMLGKAVTTPANPGIAFETWLKVQKVRESVLVAYTSERSPRSEDSKTPEHQTFILALPAGSKGDREYDLECNANGTLFSVEDDKVLRCNKWIHFACSLHNVLALGFSGGNYVDFGTAAEWNVSDFSLAFTLQLGNNPGREQIVFTKAQSSGPAPIHVTVTTENRLRLSYWAEDETGGKINQRTVTSDADKPLELGRAYKIFISRKLEQVPRTNSMPRRAQCVTMKAWGIDDSVRFHVKPPTPEELEAGEKQGGSSKLTGEAAQACGVAAANDAPLLLGGVPWSASGLVGVIGPVRFYSSAIATPASSRHFCVANNSERGLIGCWSFQGTETTALIDDTGRNHGKLKGAPAWCVSPFVPDHQLSVFLNGVRVTPRAVTAPASPVLTRPESPHQLTLGNTIRDSKTGTRFQYLRDGFHGEFDELRIWNVPRTRENFCDTMNAKLTEIPPELAVYLPFDVDDVKTLSNARTGSDMGILADHSINCWHLTPLYSATTGEVISEAPVGRDASCVQHVHGNMQSDHTAKGSLTRSSPSVTEYGQMTTGAGGSLEGVYKRAYSFIDSAGCWRLDTGFRIGSLITEWVSQVQTSPTLIGYIEGAPPIPAENYIDKDRLPTTSIRFSNPTNIQYSYGLRSEDATDFTLAATRGLGAEWKVNAGLGVETEVSAGKIKAAVKSNIDITNSQFNNNIQSIKNHSNLDMKMELTGIYRTNSQGNSFTGYDPTNAGLALVESEVADVFALRLKMRGPVSPLVAYQMRPNPDIPKDRNLISFNINKSYTKQGCLDGRRLNKKDDDYPESTGGAPKDASYYKPLEAYALKERIRRAEEQLAGEFERFTITGNKNEKDLPSRAHRNICNSYVWTADGGTFQETHSTMDFVQHEVGGNASTKSGVGFLLDMEISASCLLATGSVDALWSTHVNVMQTKTQHTEGGFELLTDLPQVVNIREESKSSHELVKRPGSVDAYRWMSFWLEPSVEGTDAFFKQVVDPKWLQSGEPNANVLAKLRDELQNGPAASAAGGSAPTKAWRLFHRVTFISRVPEPITNKSQPPPVATPAQQEAKAAALLADISCNWVIIQALEPIVRAAETRNQLKDLAEPHIAALYPTIREQPKLYFQILELLGDYIGLK